MIFGSLLSAREEDAIQPPVSRVGGACSPTTRLGGSGKLLLGLSVHLVRPLARLFARPPACLIDKIITRRESNKRARERLTREAASPSLVFAR